MNELDEDCNLVHGTDGKVLKTQVRMVNTKFTNGTIQSLYWPDSHEQVGMFKGMAAILEEQGFANVHNLKAQCKDFKCERDATHCCCHCILYT
jgi:hypothetical protein